MKLHLAHRGLFAVLSLLACSTAAPGASPGTGGSAASGGALTTGGATATGGGTTTTGGSSGAGGQSGGASATRSGGSPGTGGGSSRATGGRNGTGGRSGTGGITGTGGRGATGGATAAGGTAGLGGGAGSGGPTATGGVPGAGGRTHSGGATGAGGAPHAATWRIMPLGDSITVTTCYPQFLSKQLTDNGHKNFTFVGGNVCNQICGSDVPNTVCEGQGGMWATHLTSGGASASLLPQWCNAGRADVALVHFGTNDIWGTQPTQKILDAFSQIVDALRAAVPNVIVFAAQIIPMAPDNCSTCEARLEELNAAIPSWASGKSTAASPVYPVDLWSALPKATYTAGSSYTKDGVHPEPAAARIMADTWYQALVAKGIP
ncbi:MAG: hypothetical protein JXP73_03830 [Deltaproteobacteria bacterium]|nr:hypothetical protein [Deltaproteobacteria bacterium]